MGIIKMLFESAKDLLSIDLPEPTVSGSRADWHNGYGTDADYSRNADSGGTERVGGSMFDTDHDSSWLHEPFAGFGGFADFSGGGMGGGCGFD